MHRVPFTAMFHRQHLDLIRSAAPDLGFDGIALLIRRQRSSQTA